MIFCVSAQPGAQHSTYCWTVRKNSVRRVRHNLSAHYDTLVAPTHCAQYSVLILMHIILTVHRIFFSYATDTVAILITAVFLLIFYYSPQRLLRRKFSTSNIAARYLQLAVEAFKAVSLGSKATWCRR